MYESYTEMHGILLLVFTHLASQHMISWMWRLYSYSSWRPGSLKASTRLWIQPVGKSEPTDSAGRNYCGVLLYLDIAAKKKTPMQQWFLTHSVITLQLQKTDKFVLKCQLSLRLCAELLNRSVYFPPVNITALLTVSTLLSEVLCM